MKDLNWNRMTVQHQNLLFSRVHVGRSLKGHILYRRDKNIAGRIKYNKQNIAYTLDIKPSHKNKFITQDETKRTLRTTPLQSSQTHDSPSESPVS